MMSFFVACFCAGGRVAVTRAAGKVFVEAPFAGSRLPAEIPFSVSYDPEKPLLVLVHMAENPLAGRYVVGSPVARIFLAVFFHSYPNASLLHHDAPLSVLPNTLWKKKDHTRVHFNVLA